ncbi:MAG TPA: FixG Ig-like domain-containing protein, partial [Fimbriimonadaceae bacterium]|nr:FixG Ig-like domain-containing protein [Fimbriimonadaceae bacterium]
MSFSVRLVSDLIPVEAGASIPVSIEVQNKHTEADRYELQIEGIDPEWVAIPEAVFVADSDEVRSEKVFIKVPRTSESQAGNYPFVVRVRSLDSGDSRAVQGVVQVKPFNYLTMEISPKKGIYSPTRKQNV